MGREWNCETKVICETLASQPASLYLLVSDCIGVLVVGVVVMVHIVAAAAEKKTA